MTGTYHLMLNVGLARMDLIENLRRIGKWERTGITPVLEFHSVVNRSHVDAIIGRDGETR